MKGYGKRVERLERELAAAQIQCNPAVFAVFIQMRRITANPALAKENLPKVNKGLPVLEHLDPISGPRRYLKFSPKRRTWVLIAPLAWRALETIVESANEGMLDRFRQCLSCEQWFYAAKKHQLHCSVRCRQKRHASSKEYKRDRAAYMRNYRKERREEQEREEKRFREEMERRGYRGVNKKRRRLR